MKLYRWALLGLTLALPAAALADFQYQESSQITGGSLLSLMHMAGRFSRQARQADAPVVSTIYVSGNKMARVDPQTIEIVDLDAETVTSIDLQKRTYTQMTFEQMRQQMEKAMEQAKQKQASEPSAPQPQQPPPSNVDVQFKVNVRNTGANKQVSGLNATESILTMQLQGTDKTNGQTGAFAMTNDMWMTPEIPGYQEVREFYKRYAVKMGEVFGGAAGLGDMSRSLAAMNPGAAQGMSKMAGEVSRLQGIPIEQIMRMGATSNGDPLPAASEAPLPQSSGPQMPSAGDIARQSASSAVASQLGAFHLGGFGHRNTHVPAADAATSSATSGIGAKMGGFFGHKKAQNPSPDASANAQPAPTATVLMELHTAMTSFSTAPIDAARFAVPAGFQQVPARKQ